MGSGEPEAASAVLAGFCRAGERSGVDLVARVLVICGCRFHVVVGRMQCASARALESGLLLPAEQPHGWGQCSRSARLLKLTARTLSEVLRSVLLVGFCERFTKGSIPRAYSQVEASPRRVLSRPTSCAFLVPFTRMPTRPYTAMELDIAEELVQVAAQLDSDTSDEELADDLLLAAADPLIKRLKQEVGPEHLSLARIRRECEERGTDGDDMSWNTSRCAPILP